MSKEEKKCDRKRDFLEEFFDFIKDIVIIVLVVLFIRAFLIMPFQISGSSMDKSYYEKEFILVDRFSYLDIPLVKEGNPNRGDVVVFKPGVSKNKEFFIKRIIGLPEDTLKIEGGSVYLLDKQTNVFEKLDEGYLSPNNKGSTFVGSDSKAYVYEVPLNSYFVMGDNRTHSTDSRACFSNCSIEGRVNYIKKDYITGRVWLDLGYYDWLRFNPKFELGSFEFIQPSLGIDTHPRWFSSPSKWSYKK